MSPCRHTHLSVPRTRRIGPFYPGGWRPTLARRRPTTRRPRASADVGNVDVGRVFSVHSLLGRQVNDSDSKPLGVVSDVAIDLDDAQISMIAVGQKKDPAEPARPAPRRYG